MNKIVMLACLCFQALAQPVSTPVVPAQPTTATYGLSALNEFQTYTRASYLAKFGVQAPAYNPAAPPRTWFDTSALPGPYLVVSVNTAQTPPAQLVPMAVPVSIGYPNLSGAFQYPLYVNFPSSTTAVQVLPGAPTSLPVQVTNICSVGDAQTVANSFGPGTAITIDPSYNTGMTWNSETRRPYDVTPVGGQPLNACNLLLTMTHMNFSTDGTYASGGFGAPGFWSNASSSNPTWTPTPDPGLNPVGTPVPVPARSLLANEAFAIGPLATVDIVNTSVPSNSQGGSALTAAQQLYMYNVLDVMNKRYGLGVTQ